MSELDLLAGLSVVEIASGVAEAMCGKVLTDLGAMVTRIEPSGGDWLLRLGPTGGPGLIHAQLNAGKTVLSLDLGEPAAQAEAVALAREADAIVVGEREARFGLGYSALSAVAPRLVYCRVSGWGSAGPMGGKAASELAVQVVAGMTRYLGTTGDAPVRQGFDLVSVDTGIAAAQAILAALLWRAQSGEGQCVEASMLSTAIALMQWDITAFSGPDKWHGRQLTAHEWSEDHGFQLADARCLIDLRSNETAWPNLLREVGCGDLGDDPRFATTEGLDVNIPDLPRLTAGRLTHWRFADMERLVRDRYDGTIVPMLSLPEVVVHPQVRHIGVITKGPSPLIRFPMDVRQ